MRDIFTEYLQESEPLLQFYADSPRAVFQRTPEGAAWDPALVDCLRAYQSELGNVAEFEGNEPVIVTGQQPGLLTGPLYTIYKAVTAIKLADRLSSIHAVKCVPLFWVGAEDHDFEEAATAHILTKLHEPLTLRYEPAADVAGLPMYRVPLDRSLSTMIDRAADAAAGSEHRGEIQAFLHDSLEASTSLADWTCRILARLFRDTPLLLFSPQLPVARSLAIPVLETAIAQPLEDTRILNDTGARLSGLGYEIQVKKDGSACNFFLEVEGKRRKVTYEDGRFSVSDENLAYTPDEFRALLRAEPERFSPNVALRCIVQQHLFPAAAYVAGPGEIAYWAQLKPLFEHFGEHMPVVYPRARAVITDLKLNKLLRKHGLAVDDLYQDPDALLERSLSAGSGGAVVNRFKTYRIEIENAVEKLQREMSVGDMTAQLRERILGELDRYERGLLRADEMALQTTKQRLLRLCNSLAPARRPQERFYNVFSFLFEQGWGFIDRLIRDLDVESFAMNEVEL